MNLHTSTGQPDWAAVPTAEQNRWQRIAERSSGLLTPGNFYTVAGLGLVLVGLWQIAQHAYWLGLTLTALGRLCDIADGMAAQATGTKSPLGEALDAGFDKLASLAALIVLVGVHIITLPIALVLLAPNLLNAAFTVRAVRVGVKLHPSRTGKLFMASAGVALGCFIAAAAFRQTHAALLYKAGYVFVAGALVLGLHASLQYYRIATKTVRP